MRLRKKHDLRVIEGRPHAFGCLYKGRKIGSFGDMACFSFDGIRASPAAKAAASVTSDQAVAEAARRTSAFRGKDTEKRFSDSAAGSSIMEQQGWRYHMSNVMAAIGRVQLTRLDGLNSPPSAASLPSCTDRSGSPAGVALARRSRSVDSAAFFRCAS